MEAPPFSVMNREERHLCAIFYRLLAHAENLHAFQRILGLEPHDEAEVFVEAAFVRDYFHWWREEYRRSGKQPREFDEFCHRAFGIKLGLPPRFRAPDGFLSLRNLRGKQEDFADNDYFALLPRLANMRFDILLLTPDKFAVIETKLHTGLASEQIHLQQVLGKVLNRLPGYETHTFYHSLLSKGRHPRLRHQVEQRRPPVRDFQIESRSWAQVLESLPHIPPRQRKEIEDMLRPRR